MTANLMIVNLLKKCSIVLLYLVLYAPQMAFATSPATDWYPDPSTGLMWTGKAYFNFAGIGWKQTNQYCSTLQINGLSGWRLPTIDEAKAMLVPADVAQRDIPRGAQNGRIGAIPPSAGVYYPGYSTMFFKGGIVTAGGRVWTSTMVDARTVWTVEPGGFFTTVNKTKITASMAKMAMCVRPMEPEVLEIAKQAQVTHPVPDVLTLKADVPLDQALTAYKARNYQQSLTLSQAALAVKPDFVAAAFDIGLSYAALKQWDQAIAGFQAALTLNKHDSRITSAIKWAQECQRAETGKTKIKEIAPEWWD